MMETLIIIAGAVQLTSWLFALVDMIEKPKRKAPCNTADQSTLQEAI